MLKETVSIFENSANLIGSLSSEIDIEIRFKIKEIRENLEKKLENLSLKELKENNDFKNAVKHFATTKQSHEFVVKNIQRILISLEEFFEISSNNIYFYIKESSEIYENSSFLTFLKKEIINGKNFKILCNEIKDSDLKNLLEMFPFSISFIEVSEETKNKMKKTFNDENKVKAFFVSGDSFTINNDEDTWIFNFNDKEISTKLKSIFE
jgi:hypothetical protein